MSESTPEPRSQELQPQGHLCSWCGRIGEGEQDFDAGYLAQLRAADEFLRQVEAAAVSAAVWNRQTLTSIGFLQGLVLERKARLPIFMQW